MTQIQGSKDREIELISKNAWGKRKVVTKKKLIETPYENNVNTVVEEHVSSENYAFWCCCRW